VGRLLSYTAISNARRHDEEVPLNDRARASRTGGQLLVEALKIHGTDTVFSVPGES
jgi:hypothetical protein